MQLPQLPTGYQDAAYESLTRHLPDKWFHQLEDKTSPVYPMLWGLAHALAHVRLSYEFAQRAAIPYISTGQWLSLHLQGIGLERLQSEADEEAQDKYTWEFRPTRNTRAGELAALQRFLGLEPPKLKLETDRALGRFGQFRVVLDDEELPWSEIDYRFIGVFIQRYVTNGIVPSVDINVRCLKLQQLGAWQFSTQLPMSLGQTGGIWERPGFVDLKRLPFSRNLFAQVTPQEWRESNARLKALFDGARSDGPGEAFAHITDAGRCPYLEVEWNLELTSDDLEQTFPPRPPRIDGYHFYTQLPYVGASFNATLAVPFLEVSAPTGIFFPPADPLPLLELHELFPGFPGDSTNAQQEIIRYQGISFTRLQVTGFYDVDAPATEPEFTSTRLNLMRSGPWVLRLGEGEESWGDFPPPGLNVPVDNANITVDNTNITVDSQLNSIGSVLAELEPFAIWWTDASGNARSPSALWDGQNVFLAMEFLMSRTPQNRTIRELELRVGNQRVHYRRLSFAADSWVNLAIAFKVRGVGIS